MREESKSKKRIDFSQYLAPDLNLDSRRKYSQLSYKSCGSAALSLITGIPVKKVELYCPTPNVGWWTGRAVNFLKENGYTAIELSKNGILTPDHEHFPIKQNHCLMMNVRLDSLANSMLVFHKGVMWHNFHVEHDFNSLYFLNKPTQDVILVYHPKWNKNKKKKYSWEF